MATVQYESKDDGQHRFWTARYQGLGKVRVRLDSRLSGSVWRGCWSELEDEISADESYLVSAEDLGELARRSGSPFSPPSPERKALMQTLVAEIRVRDRSWIQPVSRVRFFDHRMDRCPRGSAPPDLITT